MPIPIWGVCGGSGSGKSTFAAAIASHFPENRVVVLPFDAYYRDLGHLSYEERCQVDFDHPDSLDVELFCEHLDALAAGQSIEVPHYDFHRHTRAEGSSPLGPADLVITEGILLLAVPAIRERLGLVAFLAIDHEVCLERRLARDVAERGRDAGEVERNYRDHVLPAYEALVAPHQAAADLSARDQNERDDMLAEVISRAEALLGV